VTQIIADRELMFSHLCQHRPDRMPKRVPAYASDADFGKSRLDLPLEDSSNVQWLLSFVAMRRENEIPWSVVVLCDFHSSNASFCARCIGNTLADASVFVGLRCPPLRQ